MFAKNYNSCLYEEIILIELYGSEIDKRVLKSYIDGNSDHMDNIVEIASSLRRRIQTKCLQTRKILVQPSVQSI